MQHQRSSGACGGSICSALTVDGSCRSGYAPAAMSWLLLALCSALSLGLYDVSKKCALRDNAVLPVLLGCGAFGAALVLPFGLWSAMDQDSAARLGVAVRWLSVREHLLVLAKAVLVTSSWVLSFFALKNLPISLAAPVRASAPAFTLVGAVVIYGERPSLLQWLGIATILLAYWAFSLVGNIEGIHFRRNRWVWLLFGGTLLGAVSALYDKHLLQSAQIEPATLQFWFTLDNVLLQAFIVYFLWWPGRSKTTAFQFRWSLLGVAALLLAADFLYFTALAQPDALVSLVSILRRTSVIVSFGVGGALFREQLRLHKAGALAFVLVGLVLLLH